MPDYQERSWQHRVEHKLGDIDRELDAIGLKIGELVDIGNQALDGDRIYHQASLALQQASLDASRSALDILKSSLEQLTEIAKRLPPPPPIPVRMELQFEGEDPMASGKETDKQTIPCTALETDADGQPVELNPANVSWAIDKLPDGSDLAELTQSADGSATFKALKVGGPVNISCTDNAQMPPLVGTNTLEVVASNKTPTAMALVFGDPQAPTNA